MYRIRSVSESGCLSAGRTYVALHLRSKGWDHIQNHSGATAAALRQAMVDSLRQSREVVVDSSNLSATERSDWISAAKQAADVSPSVIICCLPPPASAVCSGHNTASRSLLLSLDIC
jgi:hypothetical protein